MPVAPAPRTMTPAHIREPDGADHVEVMFLESARIFRLRRKTRRFEDAMQLLRDAIARHRVVQVRCTTPEGDVIEEVAAHPT